MTQRAERVAGELLKEISHILREDIEDPHIGFVTLLRADVTKDLRMARIYYSVLGSDEEKKSTDIHIRNSSKYIKKLVNNRIKLRYAVDLRFIRETGIDKSFKIDEILDKIRKERNERDSNES